MVVTKKCDKKICDKKQLHKKLTNNYGEKMNINIKKMFDKLKIWPFCFVKDKKCNGKVLKQFLKNLNFYKSQNLNSNKTKLQNKLKF